MKLIDKYLLRTFLAPFAYCMIAFILLYVIYDLFDNLPDFVDGRTPVHLVAKYYLVLLPSVLVRIVPISLLLATLYSVSSLSKNNELTALRAGGVSLLRLTTPFIAVGFLCSIAVFAINETIGPRAAFWCSKFVKEQKRGDPETVYIVKQLAIKQQDHHRIWYMNEFDIRTYEMRDIELTQQRPDGISDEWKINAEEGKWLDGRWWFSDVAIQYYDEDGNHKGPAKFQLTREMSELKETPTDFLNELKDPFKDPYYLSSKELYHYIQTHPQFAKEALVRLTVDLHTRLAQPWTCLIVALLGLPFGNQTGRKGPLLGIASCIGMFFGYYLLFHMGEALGKKMVVDPWLGGWIPNLVFLIIGIVMVYRMR